MTDDNRIHERDVIIPMLAFLASHEDGFATTSRIILHLTKKFGPEGEDAEILEGRSDTRFSQIVRNVVSHRTNENSIIRRGFADYDKTKHGLRITNRGRDLVKQVEG